MAAPQLKTQADQPESKIKDNVPFNIVLFSRCKILDQSGKPTTIGQLWQAQKIMFVFLRHFACIGCRAHAVQVWSEREKFQKNGTKIIFVGNGDPHLIEKFKVDLNILDAPIYTDPTLESFRAAGFKRGFLAALAPTALMNSFKLKREGHAQGPYDKAAGNLWQLGGIMVVNPNGTVPYHYISQVTGDFPPRKDLENKT
jgi:peroxiredoxin